MTLEQQRDYRLTDWAVIVVANLFNLIMVPVFILRTLEIDHPQIFVWVWVAFILVLGVCTGLNLRAKRVWWAILFPLMMVIFLIAEVVLDYILRLEFRSSNLLWPYLLLYYLSILGMIGYSFAEQKKVGFITLVTYFLSQIAAFYSYYKVGHG